MKFVSSLASSTMLRFAGDLSGLSVPESRGACLACLGQKQGTHARRIPKKDFLGKTIEEAHEAERKLVSLFLSSEEVEDGFISSVDSPMTKRTGRSSVWITSRFIHSGKHACGTSRMSRNNRRCLLGEYIDPKR